MHYEPATKAKLTFTSPDLSHRPSLWYIPVLITFAILCPVCGLDLHSVAPIDARGPSAERLARQAG